MRWICVIAGLMFATLLDVGKAKPSYFTFPGAYPFSDYYGNIGGGFAFPYGGYGVGEGYPYYPLGYGGYGFGRSYGETIIPGGVYGFDGCGCDGYGKYGCNC